MGVAEFFKNRDVMWLNVFIRDVILVGLVGYLQYATYFQSKTIFFISGMLLVYICWQLTDYLNEKKRL